MPTDTGFEQEGKIMVILPIILIGWCPVVDFKLFGMLRGHFGVLRIKGSFALRGHFKN